ncbi:hypothetical protein ACHHYP_09809 [Achlya hypogyna]|uniref:FYVE-type domain-containing protein n=1 Tax=Achlya hypogyna TaxID=1202772 RepID=A0A1V9YMF5_ACHHY|nr:hypothetical protein ACHHYP_09809 [Achlya hypogyna]
MSSPELSPSSPPLRPWTPTRRSSAASRSPARRPSEPPTPLLRAIGSFHMDDGGEIGENECPVCQRHFSLVRFKHRCKACNRKVCNDCSKSRLRLADMGLVHRDKKGNVKRDRGKKGARVCDPCARSYFATTMEAEPQPDNVIAISPSVAPLSPQQRLYLSEPRFKRASAAPLRLLRTRHYVVFGFFCFVLLLRVAVPGRSLHASDKYPWLFFGSDVARQVLHRMVRLDVFAAALLSLVVLDEVKRLRALRGARCRPPEEAAPLLTVLDRTPSAVLVETTPPVIAMNDPSPVDELDTFRADVLVDGLIDCTNSEAGVNMAAYLDVCAETAKLLVLFGKATAFAASTVAGYLVAIDGSLSANAALTCGDADDTATPWRTRKPPMRRVIEAEVRAGLAAVGGKKNPSVSRGVLRLLWFLDFVEATLRLCFVESDSDELGPSMSKAYETTLGSRHPWLIRKGVMSALGSVPKRSTILAGIAAGKPEADELQRLQRGQELMKRVIDDVRAILTDHELLDLK